MANSVLCITLICCFVAIFVNNVECGSKSRNGNGGRRSILREGKIRDGDDQHKRRHNQRSSVSGKVDRKRFSRTSILHMAIGGSQQITDTSLAQTSLNERDNMYVISNWTTGAKTNGTRNFQRQRFAKFHRKNGSVTIKKEGTYLISGSVGFPLDRRQITSFSIYNDKTVILKCSDFAVYEYYSESENWKLSIVCKAMAIFYLYEGQNLVIKQRGDSTVVDSPDITYWDIIQY